MVMAIRALDDMKPGDLGAAIKLLKQHPSYEADFAAKMPKDLLPGRTFRTRGSRLRRHPGSTMSGRLEPISPPTSRNIFTWLPVCDW